MGEFVGEFVICKCEGVHKFWTPRLIIIVIAIRQFDPESEKGDVWRVALIHPAMTGAGCGGRRRLWPSNDARLSSPMRWNSSRCRIERYLLSCVFFTIAHYILSFLDSDLTI